MSEKNLGPKDFASSEQAGIIAGKNLGPGNRPSSVQAGTPKESD